MNELLVKELAKEAQEAVDARWEKEGHPPYPEAHRIFIEERDKKFAELIVRKCARIVNDNDFDGSTLGDRLLFEEFGIEE